MDPHIQPNPNPKDPRIQPPPVPLEYPASPAPAPQPPALPAVRFPSAPYAPDGGCPVGGSFAVLGLTLLAGAVIGALAGLLHLVFWFPLLFPIAVGAAVGAAGLGAVVLGKVRSRVLAAFAGVLGGCVAALAIHFVLYVASGALEAGLSFISHVNLRARAGVTISSTRSSGTKDKGMNLGYAGSYIYWLIELGLMAGFAAAIPAVRAGTPFCERCDSWKTQHKLGVLFLGRDAARDHFQSGELWRLADPSEPPGEGPIGVSVWWCPHCLEAAPVDAELDLTVQKKKGVKVTKLGFRTFPGETLPVFRALCLRRGDPNIPPAVR
jgi:hypothetical protein